jgi:hypothetical protein
MGWARMSCRTRYGSTFARTAILFCLALPLAACGTPSAYAPESVFDGGYGSTETKPNIWEVYYDGTGRIDATAVEDYWLLRSAEIAISRGHPNFAVLRLEKKMGSRCDPLRVEGTIQLIDSSASENALVVLDAHAIREALKDCVGGAACHVAANTITGVGDLFKGSWAMPGSCFTL